jgi:hypothetical protein
MTSAQLWLLVKTTRTRSVTISFLGLWVGGGRSWFNPPDLGRVLRDGTVAGEPADTGHVENRLFQPDVAIGIVLPHAPRAAMYDGKSPRWK